MDALTQLTDHEKVQQERERQRVRPVAASRGAPVRVPISDAETLTAWMHEFGIDTLDRLAVDHTGAETIVTLDVHAPERFHDGLIQGLRDKNNVRLLFRDPSASNLARMFREWADKIEAAGAEASP